jgi:hypothetical protein
MCGCQTGLEYPIVRQCSDMLNRTRNTLFLAAQRRLARRILRVAAKQGWNILLFDNAVKCQTGPGTSCLSLRSDDRRGGPPARLHHQSRQAAFLLLGHRRPGKVRRAAGRLLHPRPVRHHHVRRHLAVNVQERADVAPGPVPVRPRCQRSICAPGRGDRPERLLEWIGCTWSDSPCTT